MQSTFQPQAPVGSSAPNSWQKEARDFQAEDRARREAVQLQHERLAHLRAHFERMCAEKEALQGRLQGLIESHHSAEQDRNRLRGALQDGHRGLDEIGTRRLKLGEERFAMMQEMAQIMREANVTDSRTGALAQLDHGNPRLGVMASPGEAARTHSAMPASGFSGGARGHLSWYTPTGFNDRPPAEDAVRSHWTQFDSGKGNTSGGCGGTPSFGHLDDHRGPPSFSGSNADTGMEAPPKAWESFGPDTFGGGAVSPVITEWTGRNAEFPGVPPRRFGNE